MNRNNRKKNLTIVATLLCALMLCSKAGAQTINFDDAPDGTVVNTRYPGKTFYNPLNNGSIFARTVDTQSASWAPSSPNVVSISGSGVPFFNATTGAVEVAFSSPQSTVSIDARPVSALESVGTPLNRPYLEAYSGSIFLGRVLYPGPLPTGCCFEMGPTATLTFTSPTANITRARFSSQQDQGPPIYGLFDNLTTGPVPPCGFQEVPGNGRTSSGPAIAFFNGTRLFVRGSNNAIYQNVQTPGGWTGWGPFPNAATSSGPAATVFNNQLFLFVRGTNDHIYVNTLGSNGWGGWPEVPGGGQTLSEPSATVFGNQLRLYVRGTDNGIWENVLTALGAWSGWTPISGQASDAGPAAAVFNNQLFLFAKDLNGHIRQNVLTSVNWAGWSDVPGNGVTSSGPSAAAFDNQLNLVVRGTDNNVYQNVLSQGSAWSGWLGVPGSSTPSEPRNSTIGGDLQIAIRDPNDRILMRSCPIF